jgi:hypothetical protein
VLNWLYGKLTRQYRCEYVFKNAIANRLFWDCHNTSEAYLTAEFRSGLSRADVVILNGTSTVYEVKTEFDSLVKLRSQLTDYRLVFDRICVVVPPRLLDNVLCLIDERTGVIVVDESLNVSIVREPESNKRCTSPSHIFECMRRPECERCIEDAFGRVPLAPSGRRYAALKEMFVKLQPEVAHDLMVRHVRRRGMNCAREKLLSEVPKSLIHACLTIGQSATFINRLRAVLNGPMGVL